MTQVNTFDGGLSTRIDPSLIPTNAAQRFTNVDPDGVVLKSGRGFLQEGDPSKKFAYMFEDGWVSSNYERSYVEYESRLYFSEKDRPARYYDRDTDTAPQLLGITRPDRGLNEEEKPVPVIESQIIKTTGSLSESVIQYTMTYYNDNTGIESANSIYTDEIDVADMGAVKLFNIVVSDDPQVTHKRIYRLGGDLTIATLVKTLDNETTTFTDNKPDTEATELLDTQNAYPPDIGMQYLTEAYGIFFGLADNEVRFTLIDEPNAWPPENSFKLREAGTGILVIPQGILIFTKHLTYLLAGTNVEQFSLILLSDSQGCISGQSCQVVKSSPLWVSYDGVCTLQNGYVQVISRALLGQQSLDVVQSAVYDEQYMLLKADGTLLVLDLRNGFRIYELDYLETIDGLAVSDGELHFISGGKLCKAFSDDPIKFKYTSPVFIEGNHAELKAYNHIYICAKGDFDVNMYIDDKMVLTKTMTSINDTKTFDLTCPANKQRGYGCHFDITGIGTVYTIDFDPSGKSNENQQ